MPYFIKLSRLDKNCTSRVFTSEIHRAGINNLKKNFLTVIINRRLRLRLQFREEKIILFQEYPFSFAIEFLSTQFVTEGEKNA
jgi:hypothetical protein